jgi:hypothetical protein
MELVAVVAIGLNPYVGTFVLGALALFGRHLPASGAGEALPPEVLLAVWVLAGLAAPLDFVLGKFVRFAPAVRRVSQVVAPAAGAVCAVRVSQSDLPAALVAAAGAAGAWAVAALLTRAAVAASRSPAWVGLGHVPVLMAAATLAAIAVPVAVAVPAAGLVLSAGAALALGGAVGPGVLEPFVVRAAVRGRTHATVRLAGTAGGPV